MLKSRVRLLLWILLALAALAIGYQTTRAAVIEQEMARLDWSAMAGQSFRDAWQLMISK